MVKTLFHLVILVTVASQSSGHPKGKRYEDIKCGYDSCPKYDPNALNVHLIPHSHDDVGWLRNADQYFYEKVNYIISSVVVALKENPSRTYIQVETAYLYKWWQQQNEEKKNDLRDLVNSGRLEIVNGAWSMNDEACVNYQSTIDQFTLGLRFVNDVLGPCGRPRIGWQIDPFGHSREQASVAAQLGFDGLFFARIDYRDRKQRWENKSMDLIWQGSENIKDSDIFTSVLYTHYSAPDGFCFDEFCWSQNVVIADENSPEYNLYDKVVQFTKFISTQAKSYPTNNILIPMGDDFQYGAAHVNFGSIDRLLKGFEEFPQQYENMSINVMYSTPSCYVKAVNEYVKTHKFGLPRKTDDFFPYADNAHHYWTGYFTSRPLSKRFERQSNNLMQVTKQLATNIFLNYGNKNVESLGMALGIMQHHDAITGTEKQNVTYNYHRILYQAIENAVNVTNDAISLLLTSSPELSLDLNLCLLSNVSICEETTSSKFFVILYNPLGENITEYINLPVVTSDWTVKDSTEKETQIQISDEIIDFESHQKKVLTFKAEVPAMGLTVYEVNQKINQGYSKNAKQDNFYDYIGYDNIHVQMNTTTGRLQTMTMHNTTIEIEQEFMYYMANLSGAYLFEPVEIGAINLNNGTIKNIITKGDLFVEIKQQISSWATQIIRIYKDEPDFVEFDWIVGPIPISDQIGKEVISRFTIADWKTDAKFYTDSNGRETLERIRNYRSDYVLTNEENITANYYPVTAKIVLKDIETQNEFAILNDRAQGGTSLKDGQVELMIHRRLLHDDGKGVGEALNETDSKGLGIKVRGQHFITFGPKVFNGKSAAAVQRKIAQKKLLRPITFITKQDIGGIIKKREINFMEKNLPENVHILTLEPFNNTGNQLSHLLLRFEHIFEKNEDENLSQNVTFSLNDLFSSFDIVNITEMNLSGTIKKSEVNRLNWNVEEVDWINYAKKTLERHWQKETETFYVTLQPMEIRTFMVQIKQNQVKLP